MPVLVDNIFNSNVLCFKLLKNAEMLDGGAKIVTPIEYAQNGNSGWVKPNAGTLTGGGDLANAMTEVAKKAEWDWATAYNSINISGEEKFVNAGSSQVLSVLKARMANAEKTIKDLFGTGMFATAQVAEGLVSLNGRGTYDGASNVAATILAHDNGNGLIHDMTGLSGTITYLPEGAVANTIIGYDRSLGGIDSGTPGTNDFWNSNLGTFEWAIGTVGGVSGATALAMDGSNDTGAISFDAFTSTTNGVSQGVRVMTQMYGACTVDSDQPDLIVTTQVIYDAYESSLQGNKRFDGDAVLGDAGFQSLRFKGASVVVDSHCPDGQMYFLNTKYLDYKVHSKRNFAFEDFKAMESIDAMQARIFWMGQLVCTNPRMQGMLVGGPTGY
jgi:hypothetical protein